MYEFGANCIGIFVILHSDTIVKYKRQNMKRFISIFFALTAIIAVAYAQLGTKGQPSSAVITSRVEMTGERTGKIVITLTPSKGWHVYGFEIDKGGPKPMSIDLNKSTGIKFKGEMTQSVAPIKTHDDIFDIDVTYWEGKVEFTRDFEVTDPASAKIDGSISFQGCNGETCNPPQKRTIFKKITSGKKQ